MELKEQQARDGQPTKLRWWAKGGSAQLLFDDTAIEAAVKYVMECQDGRKL
jgi:hypothetical protein